MIGTPHHKNWKMDVCGDFGGNVYVCSYNDCHKVFSKPSRLLQHSRSHTGERPYLCDYEKCGKTYARAAHLKRHVEATHKTDRNERAILDETKISCPVVSCNESFISKDTCKKHVQRLHCEVAPYVCQEADCSESFRKHHQLRAHLFQHQGLLPFQCEYSGCMKQFGQKSHLERHSKIHRGYRCKAASCVEVFTKWSLLRSHMSTAHREVISCNHHTNIICSPVHRCDVCNQQFSSLSMLHAHCQRVHATDVHVFVCCVCARSYIHLRNLHAHMRTHGAPRFTCNVCCCDVATKQKLQQHMKTHDPNWVSAKKAKPHALSSGGRKRQPMANKLSNYDGDKTSAIDYDDSESDSQIIIENGIETTTSVVNHPSCTTSNEEAICVGSDGGRDICKGR